MALCNFVYDSFLFALDRRINHIGVVHPFYGAVCGNGHNVQRVNCSELVLFGHCGTCHTCKLCVKAEIVLERNRCVGLVLLFYLYFFLSFNRLMKSVGISSSVEHTACKFVYDKNFAVRSDDVFLAVMEQLVRFKSLLYMVVEFCVFDIAEVAYIKEAFRLLRALFGNGYGLVLSVDYIVPILHFFENFGKIILRSPIRFGKFFFLLRGRFFLGVLFVVIKAAVQGADEPVHLLVQFRAFAAPARNNEGGSRFVY